MRQKLHGRGRRGVVLLLVLVMLTLLALLGVAFVFYASSSRMAARLYVEEQSQRRPDAEPELLLSYFLGQLLFDVADDETGFHSALRGHSLARDLYGMNYLIERDGKLRLTDATGTQLNEVPFNGTGRQPFDPKLPFLGLLTQPGDHPARREANLVNYTYFPADKFLRDPERTGWRPGPRPADAEDNRRPYSGGFNPPYTYPDLNHVYLAAVKADGTLLAPSFHRPWAGFGDLGPGNWRWVSDIDPTLSPTHPLYKIPQPWLKYQVLRPRPIDMGPGFPLPEEGGDVKNLIGCPGGNDSIWLDLDHPVMVAPDGRKYKPLFAPLVLDLDGRVNLNVHGNLRGLSRSRHTSHQGWGPWEVNPARLSPLPRPNAPDFPAAQERLLEWGNLLRGVKPHAAGRHGWDTHPHSQGLNLATLPPGRFYAPADYDGSRELPAGTPAVVGRPTRSFALPGTRRTPAWMCFPLNGSAAGYGNGSAEERRGHPLLYDPFRPKGPDRAFALSELEALLRYGDTGSPALGSELLRLCPKNLRGDDASAARRRRLITLASFDPDRPGVSPWFWSKSASDPAYMRLPAAAPLTPISPHHAAGPALSAAIESPLFESEFGPDGRTAAALTALRRVNLARYLPEYPQVDTRSGRMDDSTGFTVAQVARQHFAAELFEVLWRSCGAGNPALAVPPGKPGHDVGRWDALRQLAQIAVNLVDFIDSDDYMTPFNWRPDPTAPARDWVSGTELPRVVLNEAYVEYTNVPGDPGLKLRVPRATRLKANVWVELHNPMRDDPPLTAPWRAGMTRLQVPAANSSPAYAAYRMIIARLRADLRDPANVRGEIGVPEGQILRVLSSFAPAAQTGANTNVIMPADLSRAGRGYSGPVGGNAGFYVIGPTLTREDEPSPFGTVVETLRRPEMSYLVLANHPRLLLKPSLLWQRLACPALPPQPDPATPLYNPYVTVDYIRDVETNYAAKVGYLGSDNPPPKAPAERASVGKRQPYAAHPSQLVRQKPSPAAPGPQTTLFRHNADATTPGPNVTAAPADYPPFDWLVHLDRPPVSPAEVLHVSAFKPHELTQQFRTGDDPLRRFAHRAPWLDEGLAGTSPAQSHRLYRALEFLTVGGRWPGTGARTTSTHALPAAGLARPPYPNAQIQPAAMTGTTAGGGTWRIEPGCSLVIDRGTASEEVVRVKAVGPAGTPQWFVADFLKGHTSGFGIEPLTVSERLPGKINLNTVWDEEVFLALCDPNPANHFHAGTARSAFRRLRTSRTADGDTPGSNDRPFLGLAAGLNGDGEGGRQDTLLRSAGDGSSGPPILSVPGEHPYQTHELLTKVFNNTTTRSNVFAVWLTVGFFEVTDDSTRPIKLGPEVGRAEGRHVRHRMFALVDRSVLLRHPGPQPRFDPRAAPGPYAAGRVVPYFSVID